MLRRLIVDLVVYLCRSCCISRSLLVEHDDTSTFSCCFLIPCSVIQNFVCINNAYSWQNSTTVEQRMTVKRYCTIRVMKKFISFLWQKQATTVEQRMNSGAVGLRVMKNSTTVNPSCGDDAVKSGHVFCILICI